MSEKLYYNDSYIKEFTASILTQGEEPDGRWYVTLDQTAFYPTGGGQPSDIGYLNQSVVEDVQLINGEIRHYIQKPLHNDQFVVGTIDWMRRFDHMQQHLGQHILTAAFEELFGYQTTSFHLGEQLCSIDLNTEELSEKEIEDVEQLANSMILSNRLIETKWVQQHELDQYSLRKPPSVTENIRLVIIPNFDYNACGGTHPKSTGEVSSISILSTERQKQKVRVHFVCGQRVLDQLRAKQAITKQLTNLFSTPEDRIITAAERLIEIEKALSNEIEHLKEEVLEFEKNTYIKEYEMIGDCKVIKRVFEGRTMQELQRLSKMVSQAEQHVVSVFLNSDDDRFQLVLARGNAVTINMNDVLKKILSPINGKGGGSNQMAQGGGQKTIDVESYLNMIDEVLESHFHHDEL